jgi:hypothetical protein
MGEDSLQYNREGENEMKNHALVAFLSFILMALLFSSKTGASGNTCDLLIGSGPLRIVIVPAGFDGNDPQDVAHFEQLAEKIAFQGFGAVPPYQSNTRKYSIFRLNDYRGVNVDVTTYDIWYNQSLITAASLCSYNQIIVVANQSGWAGGAPGFYSVVGSGTPPTCDPVTCTGTGCPWTPTCSWDYNIAYTALHETGHTFSGLRHTCYSSSPQMKLLESMEKDVIGAYELPGGHFPAADDPINCGVGFTGSPENVCSEWNSSLIFNWVTPNDPHFGCYQGCDNNSSWYRAWNTMETIMCIDLDLRNGFTPVERKILSDFLGGLPPNCYLLEVSPNPEQGTINVTPLPNCDTGYTANTVIELTATPNIGYFFSKWSGDIARCGNPIRFPILSHMTIQADFSDTETFCGETYFPMIKK